MVDSTKNVKADRTWRKDGIIEVITDTGPIDKTAYAFVQGMVITLDANIFTRDFTGIGESVFTQAGDVIGTFTFDLKNTVDIFKIGNADIPPDDDGVDLLGTWLAKIADIDPPILTFVQTYIARKSTNANNRVRITFTGRIMTPALSQLVDVAADDVSIDGEIITLTEIERDNPTP